MTTPTWSLVAAALVVATGAVTAAADPASVEHAAARAREVASEHASFLREAVGGAATNDEASRMCDTYDTHGAYVSQVANETRPEDNESGREHGQAVSEAAQSDVGQCGGPDEKSADPDETDGADEDENAPEDDGGHGRSAQARAEHPPRNHR